MLYVLGVLGVVILCLGGLTKCQHDQIGVLKSEVESSQKAIGHWRDANADLERKVGVQNAAVSALAKAAEDAIATARQATAIAAQANARLKEREQAIATMKPEFPEDSCRSACSLLQRPL